MVDSAFATRHFKQGGDQAKAAQDLCTTCLGQVRLGSGWGWGSPALVSARRFRLHVPLFDRPFDCVLLSAEPGIPVSSLGPRGPGFPATEWGTA